jgi:2,3-bisphosphoglycerate-dependent phosphoglycerate mutase
MAGIDPRAVIEEFLDSHDLEFERKDANTFLLTLPGEKKLQTHCALIVGDHSLSINAFVIRKPDDNEAAVHSWCMTKNASMYGIAFAINELGDVFLVGRLPLFAVTDRELDRLIGSVLQYSDNSFNPLLELGFANAIRREWAWRGMSNYQLILLRHGESEWNAKNLFTGWVDVALSPKGEDEARRGGALLGQRNLLPDLVHTSLLRRAIHTSQLALDACDRHWIPVKRSWRLNERHYGALQGKDKAQTLAQYGEEQFALWRRSFDVPPPAIDDNDEFSQAKDVRYADLGALAPKTECLKDVIERMLPYWQESIVPDLTSGKRVLVTAHGNSLRALVKHLDGISDADIAGLNIPTGIPLYYQLDSNLKPVVNGGEYLDPAAAKAAITAVANQGKK